MRCNFILCWPKIYCFGSLLTANSIFCLKFVEQKRLKILSTKYKKNIIFPQLRKKNRMALVEVIPLSLGTGSCDSDEVFMPMLERNKTIPAICEKFFHTTTNDQASMTFSVCFLSHCNFKPHSLIDAVKFQVYEGERQIASKNNRLGTLHIDGLSRGKAGNVVVKLTFEIDKNGILKVSATHKVRLSSHFGAIDVLP